MKQYIHFVLLATILVISTSTNATIYREVSASGHVTFTDRQLDDSVSSSIVKIRVNSPSENTGSSDDDTMFSPNIHSRKRTRVEDLQDLTADFDDAILDNWLSSYWDCSNHFQRVDLQYNNFLQFFSNNAQLVIPVVRKTGKSLDLFYSENIKYEYDPEQRVLLSYRNNAKPGVLYICAADDVPQQFRNRLDAYLINQQFLAGHSSGPNIEIKDGAKFLDQECRLTYENKEYRNARDTCEIAATNDRNVAAKYHMGMLYRFRSGGDIDYRTSYEYTLDAANAGFSPAYTWLAWHYEFGKGIPPDYAEALHWRIASVDAGHLEDAKLVARFYMQGLGVEKDYSQAAVWLLIAARAGDPHAQNKLGSMYANGVGVKQDYEHAYYWINKAQQQNNPKAVFNLAILYEQKKVNRGRKSDAIPLYKRAKELGISESSDIIDKHDRVWGID